MISIPVLLLGGLWVAAHRIPWVGAACADGLRAVIGVQAVSRIEDFAYGIEDRFNRWWKDEQPPQAYWDVPDTDLAFAPTVINDTCEIPAFDPVDVGPVHTAFAAPGDGRWVPIEDPRAPERAPALFKTLVHPDAQRSWAAVSVVAVDLRHVSVELMAGRLEPRASTGEGKRADRAAIIPAAHKQNLLAAFNGGFKAEHGHYGMMTGGTTFLPARKLACQIVKTADGSIQIGDTDARADDRTQAQWWRQTPQCMVQEGSLHVGLRSEKNTHWGATLNGETVIRRSALGVSADGLTLYSGIGDHTTARAIALAMKHVGADDVAQLDVNWSYPKFVLYRLDPASQKLVATKLSDGFRFSPDEYVRKRAERDFFYLVRRDREAVEAASCPARDDRETRRATDATVTTPTEG